MNINLTPVSDSPKTKATASAGTSTSSEVSDVASSESGGFFAAFSEMVGDLIDGDEAAKNAPVDGSSKEGKAIDSEEVVDKKAVKSSDSKGEESTEALLKQTEDSEGDSKVTKGLPTDDDKSQEKSASNAQSEKEIQNQSSKNASQTVSESDELLGRLNESNNALKGQNGKSLPQQDEDNHQAAKTAVAAAGVKELEAQNTNKTKVDSETDPKQKVASELPDSIKPFIQDEQLEATQIKSAARKADPIAEMPPEGEQNGMKAVAAVSAGQLANQEQDAAQVMQKPSDNGEMQAREGMDPRTQPNKPPVQSAGATHSTDSPMTDEEVIAAAGVSAGAIEWNNPAALEQASIEQAVLKSARNQTAPPQNQAAIAASVQQALNQPNQAAAAQAMSPLDKLAMENMASSMPADLTQAQLQQMVAANSALPTGVHGQAGNQAALKAALGLKAANGLNAGQSNDPKDAALAQQIAQATGQQPGITATRTDAATQAQAPMQLHREMAPDQMAERVQMMMSKNLKNIDIRLDPPELGRMQIRMNMNGDNTAVHFTVTNPQARDVIEQSMPRLREMLAQQGVQLSDTSVQQQSAGQQQGRYAAQENQQSGQASGSQATNGDENLDSGTKVDLNVTTKRDGISYYA
ncbi:flagellar hook-length control protein FliK [uncultured Vibrio sp.]|uniref:flagellar hook-length control protein FliK n=1 Tax=uncultured Vibrio sp. TaxID=114054 RepID=UPI0009224D5A|nr:flagellar hook-length control protein FliK [uncultured Vibrio sp.]OIQ25600.1 MAG: hypothetical protein BM561_05880 [Vibrio sp. MedPE-SWchi]